MFISIFDHYFFRCYAVECAKQIVKENGIDVLVGWLAHDKELIVLKMVAALEAISHTRGKQIIFTCV